MANTIALPKLSFGEAIKTCFKKYATFSGRARRSEYWWFCLLNSIPGILMQQLISWKSGVLAEVESQAGEALFDAEKHQALLDKAQACDDTFFPCAAILCIIMLALLIPALAVCARRLHDIGKSGWAMLIGIIPIVNLILLFWTLKDSEPQANKYGESPKYITQEENAASQI